MLTAQDLGFVQLVNFPTHTKGNCLDLILTNAPEKVSNICEVGRLGKSDHVIIQFELAQLGGSLAEKKVIDNWKKADWNGIRQGLESTTWPTTSDGSTTEEAWRFLRDRLSNLKDQFVPKSEFRPRKSEWMTGELLRQIRRKRRLWKKARLSGEKEEYEAAARDLKNKIRAAKRGLEKKLAKEEKRG